MLIKPVHCSSGNLATCSKRIPAEFSYTDAQYNNKVHRPMHEHRTPSDIAREALKRLAMRHLAPTPANYQACYNEIANLPNAAPFPEPQLRHLVSQLQIRNDAQGDHLPRLEMAINSRSWSAFQESLLAFIGAGSANTPRTEALPAVVADALKQFLDTLLPAFAEDDARFATAMAQLLETLSSKPCELLRLSAALERVCSLTPGAVEEQREIRLVLLRLLQRIIENIGELSVDDQWFKGQIDGLMAVVSPPLTLRHLDEMERRLRDVIDKQTHAHARSLQARAEMRQMLSTFIERLASVSESSASFQGRIEDNAQKIAGIQHIEDLAPVLHDIIRATQDMAEETQRSRTELQTLQAKAQATEAQLVQLHRELDNASALARHDPLTDTLNRKGLDEALEREISAMQRRSTALSVCLLDIDNFKSLNDRLGHAVGDSALVHLANVTRRHMRPTDTLARYGGEEFVILMPDTPLNQGVEAMVRLQRELTKAIFLADKEKLLITFSAGVAQMNNEETGSEAIRRADQAMYLAKRAGKNRVFAA